MPLATRCLDRFFSALPARGGALRRAALGFFLLLTALLATSPASAAVPMCSSDGRSVAAPPMILPWRQLSLEAPKPCPQPDNLLLRSMPEQQKGPSSAPAPALLRAMPVRAMDLPLPASVRQQIDSAVAPRSVSLIDGIYRPPRS